MLTIGVLLLAGICAALIYAGIKLKNESVTVTRKINSFNAQVIKVNNNLNNIDDQLKSAKSSANALSHILP